MVGQRRRGRGAARTPLPPEPPDSEEDDDLKRAMELSMMATEEAAEEEEMDADLAAALKASLEEPMIRLESRMVQGHRRTSDEDLQEALRVSLLENEEKRKREEAEGTKGKNSDTEVRDKSPGEKRKNEDANCSDKNSDDDFDAMCSDSKPSLKQRISKADLSEACSSSSPGWLGKEKSRPGASGGGVGEEEQAKGNAVSSSKDSAGRRRAATDKSSTQSGENEVESTVGDEKKGKKTNAGSRPKRGNAQKSAKNGEKEGTADESSNAESTVKTVSKPGGKREGRGQTQPSTNHDLPQDQEQKVVDCKTGATSRQNGDDMASSGDNILETNKVRLVKKSKKRKKMSSRRRGGKGQQGEAGLDESSDEETANSADSTCPDEGQSKSRKSPDDNAEALSDLDESVFANELTIEVSDSEDPPFVVSDNSEDSDYEVSTTVPERTHRVPEVAAGGRGGGGPMLDREAVTRRMQGVFQSGLEIHFSGEEMEACRAISTPLFPHQRIALAWMFRHETKETDGMCGGILADDMGLGKTLTVIALIFTNHWDGKPLAKPDLGYTRPPLTINSGTSRGRKGKAGAGWKPKGAKTLDGVGSKAVATKSSITNVFDKFKKANGKEESSKTGKFSFQKDRFIAEDSSEEDDDSSGSMKDFIDDQSSDEFDDMTKNKKSSIEEKKTKVFERMKSSSEDDSEDEDFKKMSAEEQMLAMIPRSLDGICDIDHLESESEFHPGLNLDGFLDDSDSEDGKKKSKPKKALSESDTSDLEPEPEKSKVQGKRAHSNGSVESPPKRSKSNSPADEMYESDASLPEVEQEQAAEKKKENLDISDKEESEAVRPEEPRENGESGLKLLVPPKEIAVRGGRRRPTLLVCPTSLISHWVEQLQSHVHKSVAVKLKVHHGNSKAFYAGDLESHDIVITTYGTLAAEFTYGERSGSPLLKAKWLRVVLDEGHMVKNHLSKSHKAVLELDTLRKWVITGTPIQNNLMELWSLTNFLDFGMYAGKQQMRVFKQHIVRPCKHGDPRGFERLQVLLEAICLRRSKTDKKPDGSLLVKLPKKIVLVRNVELTEEERLCYGIFHKQAADIVGRYHRRGQLMRNYAHIFYCDDDDFQAMMMRLRQLCCHRELIKEVNWAEVMKDKEGLKRQLEGFLATEEAADKKEGDGGEGSEEEKRLVAQLRQMIKEGVTDDCSICLDDLKSPVITPCAHVFCKACIEAVIENMKPPSCPLCRRSPISSKSLLEAGHQEEGEEEEDRTLSAMEDIVVNASSSKINAVLKEIMRIARDAPEDKIVVVSQFTSFLSVLQPLLQEKNFSFTRLDGAMSHQVMLLSLKAGGVGLNLTAANHLLLLDPAWNPASEWQCFDRTHRLGQKKDVTIYKYITKDTIEEKMIEIQSKKKDLISGAFHMDSEERRRERIADIRNIFSI